MDINRVIADVLNQPLTGGSDAAPGMGALIGGAKSKKRSPGFFQMLKSPFMGKRSATRGTRSSKWLIGGSTAALEAGEADEARQVPLTGGSKARRSGGRAWSCGMGGGATADFSGALFGGSVAGVAALAGGKRRRSPRTGRYYNWSPKMEATKNRVQAIAARLETMKKYKGMPRNQILKMAMKMQ